MNENNNVELNNSSSEVVLSTKKINSVDKIFVDQSRASNAPFLHKYKRIVISLICLFILLFSLATVPYTGQYIDAFIFEYIFGQAKYIVYIWLIILCFLVMFKAKCLKKIFSINGIIVQILFAVGLCVIISAVDHFLHTDIWHDDPNIANELVHCFASYHTKHFWEYATRTNVYNYIGNSSPWWINTYYANDLAQATTWVFTGGLIGEIFVDLAEIILVLFGLYLIIIGFYLISKQYPENKFWKGINRFFSKIAIFKGSQQKVYQKLAVQPNDVKVKKNTDQSISSVANTTATPPISFLTDTSVDNYQQNKLISEQILKSVNKYINQYNLNIEYLKNIVMPLFSEIHFSAATQEDIDTFIKNDLDLSLYTKLNEFNISYKKSELRFEYKNKKPSKISIRSILTAMNLQPNANKAVIGLSYGNDPLAIDFNVNHNLLIMGYKGSGCSMLLSVILMSYAYLNSIDLNQIDLICKSKDSVIANQFFNLPHLNKTAIFEKADNSINELIQSYYDELKTRQHDFEVVNASSIDEYNKIMLNTANSSVKKRMILVFDDFNEIMYNDYHYTNMLNNLLSEGYKYGIHLIICTDGLSKELKDPLIYDLLDTKLVLKLKSESESQDIFHNYYGIQLYSNGDGYFIHHSQSKPLRFQACYLNQVELVNNICIINTFYKNKN